MRVAGMAAACVGAGTFSTGLWGLWGWPAAALFMGALLLMVGAAMGAELAKKRRV